MATPGPMDQGRDVMRRILISNVALSVMLMIGVVLIIGSSQEAAAETHQAIAIEITFLDRQGNDGKLAEGLPCGYVLSPIPNGLMGDVSSEWPLGKQLIVRDAADHIIGTVDLTNVFEPSVLEGTQSRVHQPGVINERGACVVTGDVAVPESPFYTFEIDGIYIWTMQRDALEAQGWEMPIFFIPQRPNP